MLEHLGIPARTLDRNLAQLEYEGKVNTRKVGTCLYFFAQKPIERIEFGLSTEELEALCLAEKFLAAYANTPLEKHFKSAVSKIRLAAKDASSIEADLDNKYSVPHMPHLAFMGAEVFERIQEAYDQRKIVIIDYYTFSQQKDKIFKTTQHEVEPSKFIYKDNRWYLLAFRLESKNFSLYALSRVKNVEILDKGYKLRLKQMQGFINSLKQEEPFEVVCSISQKILPYIYEMNQFPNGHPYLRDEWKEKLTGSMLKAHLKENIKYKISFDKYEWQTLAYKYSFEKWALGWGKDLTIQGPKEYVKHILANIEQMHKKYRDRIAEIEANEIEFSALKLEYSKEPQKVISDWIDKLKVRSKDQKQLIAEKIHEMINGAYQADKGSMFEVLSYFIRLEARKSLKTKALPDYMM
jgi:predicted DNA-binding transcriptional regulator YafY